MKPYMLMRLRYLYVSIAENIIIMKPCMPMRPCNCYVSATVNNFITKLCMLMRLHKCYALQEYPSMMPSSSFHYMLLDKLSCAEDIHSHLV